ncbi:MAG: hypothetical protein BA066_03045 [Candidatus Korarchaeota archaeon NZ13-K]|nr:MAG: hypothetical protein BA066_03045 [Candidatus Korarchaeota archaeon NZ13-K]
MSGSPSRFFRCPVCGRIVEEHLPGRGPLICCGVEMMELLPNSGDTLEEHLPRVYSEGNEIVIEVGIVPHDMNEENRILWVEVVKEGSHRVRSYLDFSRRPEASLVGMNGPFKVRVLCSKHGVWEYLHEPVRLELSEAVSRALDKYNSLRGRESQACVVSLSDDSIRVEFSGNFCRTCGFYDYFEDLRQLLEEFGVKSRIRSIEEFEDGAFVTYSIEGS